MDYTWRCTSAPKWSALHLTTLPDGHARVATSYGSADPTNVPVVLDHVSLSVLARHAALVGQVLDAARAIPDRRQSVLDSYWTPEMSAAVKPASIRIDVSGGWVETGVRHLLREGWVCSVTAAGPQSGCYNVFMAPHQWTEVTAALALYVEGR